MAKNTTLKTTMQRLCILIGVISCVLFSIYLSIGLQTISKISLQHMIRVKEDGLKEKLIEETQIAKNVLKGLHEAEDYGEITREYAQEEAKKIIKNLRYGKNNEGYFWIDSTDYILIAHPILPHLEGNNRYNLEDPNGVKIVQEIVNRATGKINDGNEFGYFMFTKDDGVTVAPKWTYSLLFEPWGWIVSTGEYADTIDLAITQMNNEYKTQFAQTQRFGIIVVIAILVISIIIATIFANNISKPLHESTVNLQKIATGDLTSVLKPTERTDETGILYTSVVNVSEWMKNIIKSLKTNSIEMENSSSQLEEKATDISTAISHISTSADELSALSNTQAQSSSIMTGTMQNMCEEIENLTNSLEMQSADVSNASAAVNEMVANINSISENINKFSAGFTELAQHSSNGTQTVTQLVDLANEVSEHSESLRNMNKMIADVARQTNLLAMNAAIEAAHAGSAGRGFAVVSEEIRKLSENTTKQSQQIAHTLDAAIANISEVLSASQEAGNLFNSIVTQINTYEHIITEIHTAMDEQNHGNMQIESSLENINDVSHGISANALSMNESSKKILAQILEQEQAMEKLRRDSYGIDSAAKSIGDGIAELSKLAASNKELSERSAEEVKKFKL